MLPDRSRVRLTLGLGKLSVLWGVHGCVRGAAGEVKGVMGLVWNNGVYAS